jgi:hypothetical protein
LAGRTDRPNSAAIIGVFSVLAIELALENQMKAETESLFKKVDPMGWLVMGFVAILLIGAGALVAFAPDATRAWLFGPNYGTVENADQARDLAAAAVSAEKSPAIRDGFGRAWLVVAQNGGGLSFVGSPADKATTAVSAENSHPIRDSQGCVWGVGQRGSGNLDFIPVLNKDKTPFCIKTHG